MKAAILFVLGLLVGTTTGFFAFGSPDPAPAPSEAPELPEPKAKAPSPGVAEASLEQQQRQPELPTEREDATVRDGATVRYDDAFGTLVYGTAMSSDGTPIDSCNLSFTRADNSRVRRSASVETGNGYALTGLTPGKWKVYGKPDNHARMDLEVEILDAPTQRIDLVFEPSFLITVKVRTPEGQPLHEAIRDAKLGYRTEVVVVGSTRPFEGDLPMTELRGHSRFGIGTWRSARGFEARRSKPAAKDVAGTIELSQPPPVHLAAVFRHIVLATTTVEPGATEAVLEVSIEKLRASTSTIRLQVMNASTGLPVPKANVAISDSQSGGGGRPTDDQGRITFENERVGILELDIRAKGLGAYHRLLRVVPGELDLGTIRLQPPVEMSVRAVKPDGSPLSGATVQWQNLDLRDFPQPSMYRRSNRTDAEGVAKLHGVSTGRYMVQAFERGAWHGTTVVDTSRLSSEPVTITVKPVASVNIGATSKGQRTDVHCFTIFDQQRTPVWARFVRGYPTRAELPAGKYTWELHSGETLLSNGAFELEEGAEPKTVQPH